LKNNPRGLERKIYCAPGNAGISQVAECVPIKATDIEALCNFAESNGIDLTIIGPEDALALGAADVFNARGLAVFGPTKEAAKLEWSKAFAKEFMRKYNIPTANYSVFNDFDSALSFICNENIFPAVVKADGVAVGKGVYICQNLEDAKFALKELMIDRKFGESGASVVVEEYLEGPETTVLAFCDGKTILPMLSSMDYQKIFDGDKGPNTGGMGAVCPSPYVTDEINKLIKEKIIDRTLNGLISENIEFKGILYFGLMLTKAGPCVIEYNTRFGDPETQAVLPLLETDLSDVISSCLKGTLDKQIIKWDNSLNAACVVLASGGYPGEYGRGYAINGLENIKDALVFHAGTTIEKNNIVTSGGRVLGITATGKDIQAAAKQVYQAAEKINFKNLHMRTDIGK